MVQTGQRTPLRTKGPCMTRLHLPPSITSQRQHLNALIPRVTFSQDTKAQSHLHSRFQSTRTADTMKSKGSYYDVLVAWATQVSLPQLGARVEAYVHTKVTITTFRIVTTKATSSSLGNLPHEIINMVARHVRNAAFEDRIGRWMQGFRCLTGQCSELSHLTKSDFGFVTSFDFRGSHEEWIGECIGSQWDNGGIGRHQQSVERWFNLLTESSMSRFYKCLRVSISQAYIVAGID